MLTSFVLKHFQLPLLNEVRHAAMHSCCSHKSAFCTAHWHPSQAIVMAVVLGTNNLVARNLKGGVTASCCSWVRVGQQHWQLQQQIAVNWLQRLPQQHTVLSCSCGQGPPCSNCCIAQLSCAAVRLCCCVAWHLVQVRCMCTNCMLGRQVTLSVLDMQSHCEVTWAQACRC
jgi:hypothetical protein